MSFLADLERNIKNSQDNAPSRQTMIKRENVRLSLAPGDYLIRFLPPKYEDKVFVPAPHTWALVEYTHWNIPRSDKDAERFVCPANTYPGAKVSCPICTAVDDVKRWATRERKMSRDEVDEMFGRYRMGKRAHVNCIVRGNPETQTVEHNGRMIEIPKIWVYGLPYKTVYVPLSEAFITKDPSGGYMYGDNPLDAIEGHDMLIKVAGQGIETRYSANIAKSAAIHKDPEVLDAICANAYDLSKFVRLPNEEQMEHAKVLADRIKGMKNSPVQPTSAKVTPLAREAKPAFAEFSLPEESRPACYGNHLTSFAKCMTCKAEPNCSADSAELDRSIAERRQVHGLG